MDILETMKKAGIVPVVVIDDPQDAVPTAKALLAGGINVMEITFRTEAAAESIKRVAEECPEMVVGAGTVITPEQCQVALSKGARFIVSPGFEETVVSYCVSQGVTVLPGCITPAEIMEALKWQLSVVKYFPAEAFGGLPALTMLSAPFKQIKFLPTGGVDETNIRDFLEKPFVHAVGGSFVCPKKEIAAKNFETITALCKSARKKAFG